MFSYTRAGVYTRTHTRVSAAASSTLNFQARLMNNSGSMVADGSYSIEFNLYAAAAGGTTQWTETQSVTARNGYLSVNLGSSVQFPTTIDWTQEQWLTMNVNADGEMNPRIKLTAVPFAFQAAQLARTNGANQAILQFTNPTDDRTINLPDASGTVAVSASGVISLSAAGNISLSGLTTNGDLLYHNGTSAARLARGGNGECLTSNGTTILWGSCSGLAPTLQTSYAAGSDPHITLNSTQGKLTIRDNASALTGNLFEITGSNGSTKYLEVSASGIGTSGTLTSGGLLTVSSGGASITGGIDNNSGGLTEVGSVAGVTSLSLSGAISGGTTITGTTLNGTTGINTGASAGTQRIDATGNLVNIGALTLSGAISGGTTVTSSGNINTTGGTLQTNSTDRIDNSGNLTNIGNITGTGAVTLSSGGTGALTLNTAAQTAADTASAGLTLRSGNASGTGLTSNSGNVTIDSGTSTNGTTGIIYLGTANASAVNIGRNGVTTAIAGLTSLTGGASVNGGIDNNSGGLTEVGAMAGVTNISLSGTISGGTTITGTTLNGTTGINTGANAGTQRIDENGNLVNIAALTLSGAISGGTTYSGSGNINSTGGALQTNSTDRIDNSGNLTNIGNITGSGALVLSTGGTGGLTLNTNAQTAASTASAGIIIRSGNASGTGATSNSGDLTLDVGTSTNGTTGIVYLGTSNTSAVNIGRSGITSTVGGTLVVSGSNASIGTNSLAGTLTLYDGSNNTGLFQTAGLGSNRIYTLPDAAGTVCLDANNCNNVLFAQSSAQIDSTTNTSIFINKTGASGNILTLQKSGNGVFTIANGGATQISTDSTTAFQVRNAAGTTNYLTVNTSGAIIQIGSSSDDTTGVLFVLDSKSGTDPVTGVVNGAQYYNTTSNRFRCYENSAWRDCTNMREDLVARWDSSSTKTNIGTTFVDIFTQTNAEGKSMPIDTNDKTQLRLVVNWNRVGTGTQTVQILEVGTANVLATMTVVAGRNDSGLIDIPAFAEDAVKYYKVQARSTTAGDDPVFEGASITLR